MDLGQRIYQLRKTNNLSQEALAQRLGVSRQAISKWEAGASTPELENIVAMSETFDVTTDYILKGIRSPLETQSKRAILLATLLYPTSTIIMGIGLCCAIIGWYEYQTLMHVLIGLIIESIGVISLIVASILSPTKPRIYIRLINTMILIFIPISLISGYISIQILHSGWIAPYPIGLCHTTLFLFGMLSIGSLIHSVFKRSKVS